METFVQTFSDLIRDRLGELRLNAFAAENAAGLPPDAIRNVLRSEKQAGPTLARTKEICDALGLEIRIAPRHVMATLNEAVVRNMSDADAEVPAGFLTIPWAEPSIGSGSAPVCFSRTWLDQHDLKIDFLKAVAPDIIDIAGLPAKDSLAILDTRPGFQQGHGIWSFRTSGVVKVSNVTFQDGVTVIHAADSAKEPQIIQGPSSATITILGKVVWLGQSVPLKGKVG